MSLRLGNNSNPTNIYYGSNSVDKIYLGTSQVWPDALTGTPGTFRVRTSITDETWTEVSDGDVIETVAPGRCRVWVDNFVGWATTDPRDIWVDTDYGERYNFQHTDHPDLPAADTLRRLSGVQAGYYPGILSGHSMRGTDMSGAQVLTATYDQGNGAPIGTLDQTVTVTVVDGLASDTLSFTVRLIHPDVYYADRDKSVFTGGQEVQRLGTVYVSRDGDFSDAPPARAATASVAGIFHVTIANGEFDTYDMRGWVGVSWGDETSSARVMFKAGETFNPIYDGAAPLNPVQVGPNGQMTTWFHTGPNGSDEATIDAVNLLKYEPSGTHNMMLSNGNAYSGTRISNLKFHVSDYDVSDVTWREWWNELKYTNKAGVFTENTETVIGTTSHYNGEVLTNGNGVYSEVIYDDGVDTLICRQVVDTADTDDLAAVQAFFMDGDTLTGATSGATATFTTTGSRQDRTQKVPAYGISMSERKCVLLDNIQIIGAGNAIGGLGLGAVISDSLIKNYWNYGAQQTGGDSSSWSESGVVTVQPLAYEGTPRDFGGLTVSPNRNQFNAMITANTLATNDVSHACRRFARLKEYSAHYCFASTYGGHGGAHQPMQRLGTEGTTVENDMTVQFFGCGFRGGNNQIHYGLAGSGTIPMTPTVIRIENCHLLAGHGSQGTNFFSTYTNYTLRNCILDQPAGTGWQNQDISWVTFSDTTYSPDPDINPVDPVIEFNTFTALLNTTPASNVEAPAATIRSTSITYRNNAFILDQPVLGTVEPSIAAMADEPADFDSSLRPTAGATNAYQTGVAPRIEKDAAGTTRPTTNYSKGAFESS